MKINECDCVILCGGLGKRLQGVVSDVPKVMAQIDGRPFLDFVIEHLRSQQIERIVLCTGYKADQIESYYRDHDFGITIDFSTESEPLGTGGALKNASDIISSDPFFVLNGDSFLSADFQAFLDFHKVKESTASLLVSQVNESKDFGSLKLDENSQIVDFQEKDQDTEKHLVNAGIYCFNREVFSHMSEAKVFSLEHDLFPSLLGSKFFGYRVDKEFMDIGTPQRYESVKQKLIKDTTYGRKKQGT